MSSANPSKRSPRGVVNETAARVRARSTDEVGEVRQVPGDDRDLPVVRRVDERGDLVREDEGHRPISVRGLQVERPRTVGRHRLDRAGGVGPGLVVVDVHPDPETLERPRGGVRPHQRLARLRGRLAAGERRRSSPRGRARRRPRPRSRGGKPDGTMHPRLSRRSPYHARHGSGIGRSRRARHGSVQGARARRRAGARRRRREARALRPRRRSPRGRGGRASRPRP